MFYWIRRLVLNSIYRRLIKNSVEPKKIKSSRDLKNISVILDHRLGVDKEHFKEIGNYFKIPIKNIRVVTFFQSKKQIGKTVQGESYTPENISNLGVFNGFLSDFCNLSTDVLINYYDKDDINLKYLSARINKKLSVGFSTVDNELNDLIIEVDARNVDIFVSECVKYLKIFFTFKK